MEFEAITEFDNPSQGDVIEWVGNHRESPWRNFGVIVTADCDIVREKHAGILSFVPAFTTEDFIWHFWRPSKINKGIEVYLDKAAKRISSWREKHGSAANSVSKDAVQIWLERVSPDELLAELGVTDKGEKNSLKGVIDPVFAMIKALRCDKVDLRLLIDAYKFINAKYQLDTKVLHQDIQSTWESLPGDIFHIPTSPDLTLENKDGLFLLLRHITQINNSEVSARPDDIRRGTAKARRIARVTAPYRYAITQNLGKVFSDIGLPEEHEKRCKVAAKSFFENRGLE